MCSKVFDPAKHDRRSIRLPGYYYSEAGAYFITICTQNRTFLFGEVADGRMLLNDMGQIIHEEWMRSATIRPRVSLDSFAVMPNHVHGIIILDEGRNTLEDAPMEQFGKPVSDSIPTIVRLFKSATAKCINIQRGTPGVPVWQRNYYEHVVRDDDSPGLIRVYIENNPQQWEMDGENPNRARGNVPLKRDPWRV